ncbi:MAG: DUF3373 family protein [Planctomycetes bacterium]|nr:DUF3373 family protein [Planctomycetota bacterium]
MKKWTLKLVLVAIAIMIVTPQIAKADELSDLKAQMAAMQKQLERLEAKQTGVDQKVVDRMVSEAITEKKAEISGVPEWVQRTTLFGDFRFRLENMDDNRAVSKRNRNRIRARIGLKSVLNDEWDVGFRIASGSGSNATSTNQTLDSGFTSKQIWLDLAYADYHPESIEGLNVIMGKMKNPFYNAGKNQLIWDSDVNPEGGAVKYTTSLNSDTTAYFNAGGFWVNEESGDADTSVFGFQGLLKHKFEDGTHLTGGVSYYDYGNIQGNKLNGLSGFKGNSNDGVASPNGTFDYDYDLLEVFGEYGFTAYDMPVALYGTHVENVAAPSSLNKGYLLGVKLNKAKNPGTWQAGYNYRDIDPDAVIGALNDSDFIDGGTDGRGHKVFFKYQLTKNVQTGFTYFDNEAGVNNDNFKRAQWDLVFKF